MLYEYFFLHTKRVINKDFYFFNRNLLEKLIFLRDKNKLIWFMECQMSLTSFYFYASSLSSYNSQFTDYIKKIPQNIFFFEILMKRNFLSSWFKQIDLIYRSRDTFNLVLFCQSSLWNKSFVYFLSVFIISE